MKGFKVNSGRIQVSDPCYDGGTHSLPAKNGTWVARTDRTKLDGWGTRISKVLVHHEGWDPVGSNCTKKKISVGVDSGQMGVFDASKFGDDTLAYFCCRATNTEKMCGYVPMGFVTSSGLGDGSYEGTVWREDGKAVAVEIVFLTD